MKDGGSNMSGDGYIGYQGRQYLGGSEWCMQDHGLWSIQAEWSRRGV